MNYTKFKNLFKGFEPKEVDEDRGVTTIWGESPQHDELRIEILTDDAIEALGFESYRSHFDEPEVIKERQYHENLHRNAIKAFPLCHRLFFVSTEENPIWLAGSKDTFAWNDQI